jgi:hypothetical protein
MIMLPRKKVVCPDLVIVTTVDLFDPLVWQALSFMVKHLGPTVPLTYHVTWRK